MLVFRGWWLWLEGVVPPPVGAFAGRPGIGRDIGWGPVGGRASDAALSGCPSLSVTVEVVGGSGDGDVAAVVRPVVERAEQDQVGQFGGAAVFPVPDVVGVQSAGGPAARGPRSWGRGAPGRGAAAG